jgi:hypothetical protein
MTIGFKSCGPVANPDRGRPASSRLARGLALLVVGGAMLALPAFASATTYCVNDGSCSGTPEGSVQQALDAASGNAGPDTVQIGAGTYSNPGGFVYDSAALDNGVTIVGAGQGTTTLTMPGDPDACEQVLSINDASSVNDLSIKIPGTPGVNTHQDIGLDLDGSKANHVSVSAASSANDATGVFMVGNGSSFVDGTVSLPYGGHSTGVASQSNSGLVRSTVKSDYAFTHSTSGDLALLSRVTLKPGVYGYGAWTDAGPIQIKNSLINLGTANNSVGLMVANGNGSVSPKSINADHVTIVGGGAYSRGLQVLAMSPVANGAQLASASLTNSTIKGPAVPIDRDAQNTSPTNPGQSKATVTTSYSHYNKGASVSVNGSHGAGAIVDSHFVPGSPTFVSGGNYTPAPGSILVDAGNPSFSGSVDLAGNPRVRDGNGDGKAITDLGAYERQP